MTTRVGVLGVGSLGYHHARILREVPGAVMAGVFDDNPARLETVAGEVARAESLPRTADLFEEAARAMLADLGEWQLSHQQRELVIPG